MLDAGIAVGITIILVGATPGAGWFLIVLIPNALGSAAGAGALGYISVKDFEAATEKES